MVSEAEKHSKEDKEKREAIDTKNQADSVIYQTEKQVKELGEKIDPAIKAKVEAKVQELKGMVAEGSTSTQAIKDGIVALNQEVMQIGQSIYSQQGGPAGPSTDGTSKSLSTGNDVIDADFSDSA